MKALKKAEQKNAIINRDFYTEAQLQKMRLNKEIYKLSDIPHLENIKDVDVEGNEIYRISLEGTEIKVVLDEYGYYQTVVKTANGEQYFVCLH